MPGEVIPFPATRCADIEQELANVHASLRRLRTAAKGLRADVTRKKGRKKPGKKPPTKS